MLERSIKLVLVVLFVVSVDIGFVYSEDVDQIIRSAVDQYNRTADYTCYLDKRVRKGDTLYEELNIYVKHKKPDRYYFRWNRGMQKGQEAIFVRGRYDGKILAHPGGIFNLFTLHLDPEGTTAMKKNLHPLNDSGLGKVMNLIETNYERSRNADPHAVRYVGQERFNGRDVLFIKGTFPENKGYYAHKIIVLFDSDLKLPVKVAVYDWSGTLLEEYIFRDLAIDVGFSEYDFDPDNPAYNFH